VSEYLSAFKNKTVEALFLEKYDLCLKMWPVPYEEEYIETEIGQTYVIKCGNKEGPVLVLLHGKGFTSAMWSPNIAELALKYYIIAVDIPSDINKTRFKKIFDSAQEAADWLISVMDKPGIDKFSLMGVSYGSFFAMNTAVLEPKRVESLIIIAPTAKPDIVNPIVLDFLNGVHTGIIS
jgi:pimeloyl-ACP methyl ester carboxylesterase